MPPKPYRIDLLIYAHDGRGLGHASRGIAIGSAFRRLYPERKVLFVSGCRHTATLIGPAPLDWIKLPAYETVIVDGAPQNIAGHINLKVSQLVRSRKRLLQAVLEEFRPRCVLVDHEAQGKKAELVPAIEQSRDTFWVLGLRSIVGKVDNVWSEETVRIFKNYYRRLFWYGDTAVLGDDLLEAIRQRYHTRPFVTGYISRLKEMIHWIRPEDKLSTPIAGTIAVSWQNKSSLMVLNYLHTALSEMGDQYGCWHIYSDFGKSQFKDLPFCRVRELGPDYLYSVTASKTAMVYGGYNSLSDILSIKIPAVVLLRDIVDREQELHVARLASQAGASLLVFPEKEVTPARLQNALETQLRADAGNPTGPDMNGAETAARKLAEYIDTA